MPLLVKHIDGIGMRFSFSNSPCSNATGIFQHDLTPRIYVLHKIATALKFMSYINQKLRPSYQTGLNLHILKISGRSERERAEQPATGRDH